MIEEKWQEFCLMCFGSTVDPEHYKVLRRVFFAGAATLLGLLLENLAPEDGEPTDVEIAKVTILNDEIQAFKQTVGRGQA